MEKKKETVLERDFTLNEKLAIIQTEFKSKKSRFNSFGKYNFRSAEDILEATKPFLLRLGVTVTVSEELIESNQLFPVLKSIATISDGTDAILAIAIVGVDLDQKGMQMPQKFGSASSYGKKYALGNLFLIDDTQDPDHGKAEPKAKVKIELGSETFDKAKAYVKDQTTLDTILNKYDVSPDAVTALKKLIN
jgi:hypothetical protein